MGKEVLVIKNNFLLLKEVCGVTVRGEYCVSVLLKNGTDIDITYTSNRVVLEVYTKIAKLIKEYNNIKAEEIVEL